MYCTVLYCTVLYCTTVLQACMDIVANPPRAGEPSYDSWLQQKEVEHDDCHTMTDT